MESNDTLAPPPAATYAYRDLPAGYNILTDSRLEYNACRMYARNHGWRIVTRRESDGWRVWRLACMICFLGLAGCSTVAPASVPTPASPPPNDLHLDTVQGWVHALNAIMP